MPESARWLINRGRHKEAEKIIRKVAKVNKKELPDVLFEDDEIDELKVNQAMTQLKKKQMDPKLLQVYHVTTTSD